jgi:cellulose synthase/poly-beta-1,6-N-acetylglucosamine synthase-like glycosyltransferase
VYQTASITAILPAYNEEVAIGSVVLRTRKYADRVIVVDDGSHDRTGEVAEMAGAEVAGKAAQKWACRRGAFIANAPSAKHASAETEDGTTKSAEMREYNCLVRLCDERSSNV